MLVEWVNELLYSGWDWDLYVFEETKKEVISRQLNIVVNNNLKMEEISKTIREK